MIDNTCIYPDLIPIHELGPNRYVYLISPTHIQKGTAFPDYLRLSIICMTLSHRINRTRNDIQSNALAETFFRYRGLVIRSLNDDINLEHRRTADVIIAGIITLLLADVSQSSLEPSGSSESCHKVQQGPSPHWRCHLEGVQKLIALRGGMRSLAGSTSLEPLLLSFVLYVV